MAGAAVRRSGGPGDFLARRKEEATTIGQAYTRLKEILGIAETE